MNIRWKKYTLADEIQYRTLELGYVGNIDYAIFELRQYFDGNEKIMFVELPGLEENDEAILFRKESAVKKRAEKILNRWVKKLLS